MGELFAAFGIDWRLLIMQLINFALLLVALWYFLYRPVIALIDTRREKIEEGVKDAERAHTRLSEIEGERDTLLREATQSADTIVATSKTRAEEEASSIVGTAHTRAESIVTDAQARAEEAKRRALRESKEEIGKAAILAAAKIVREK